VLSELKGGGETEITDEGPQGQQYLGKGDSEDGKGVIQSQREGSKLGGYKLVRESIGRGGRRRSLTGKPPGDQEMCFRDGKKRKSRGRAKCP